MSRSLCLALVCALLPATAIADGTARQNFGLGQIITLPEDDTATDEVTLFGQGGSSSAQILDLEDFEASDDVRLLHRTNRNDSCDRPVRRRFLGDEQRFQFEVCYDDLMPLSEDTVPALYKRLERAARRSCPYAGEASYTEQQICRNAAVETAVYSLSDPALLAYHATQSGSTPRTVVIR